MGCTEPHQGLAEIKLSRGSGDAIGLSISSSIQRRVFGDWVQQLAAHFVTGTLHGLGRDLIQTQTFAGW